MMMTNRTALITMFTGAALVGVAMVAPAPASAQSRKGKSQVTATSCTRDGGDALLAVSYRDEAGRAYRYDLGLAGGGDEAPRGQAALRDAAGRLLASVEVVGYAEPVVRTLRGWSADMAFSLAAVITSAEVLDAAAACFAPTDICVGEPDFIYWFCPIYVFYPDDELIDWLCSPPWCPHF
jgi:hypothetical protein